MTAASQPGSSLVDAHVHLQWNVSPFEFLDSPPDYHAALALFEADKFDIVLTDWNMPVMDGLTLLKEIRSRDQEIPIVMITTEAERARVVTAIEAGVSDYLVKPFTADALNAKLDKWVPAGA